MPDEAESPARDAELPADEDPARKAEGDAEPPARKAEPPEGEAEPPAQDAESPARETEPDEGESGEQDPAVLTPRIHRRRASTQPPVGSDPTPSPEPARHATNENDEQLRRDKPPHWG